MILVFKTLLAGAIGTIGMSFLMTVIHRARWANADMIRALGSMATGRYEGSLLPGLAIHLTSGMLFAFPYAIVLSLVGTTSIGGTALLAGVMGLFHGIVVSFILLAAVRGMHPVEKFRKAGLEVAVAHVAGHIGYGFVLGGALGLLDVHWRLFAVAG